MKSKLLSVLILFVIFKSNSQTYDYTKNNDEKDAFFLKFNLGMNLMNFEIDNSSIENSTIDFGNKVGIHIGVELEYVIPTNGNKLAIFIEPNYISFNNVINRELFSSTETIEAKVTSLNIPLGVRHYFFISEKSRLFLNALINIHISSENNIDYKSTRKDLESNTNPTNFGFGFGYSFDKKFSLETRIYTKFNALNDFALWNGNFSMSSLVFSYSIL